MLFFFKRSKLEKKKKKLFLKKNKKTLYIIRPTSEDGIQGLMSLFIQTLRKIDYANSKGYIPYVDFENYKTQYYERGRNSWEFFFTQPKTYIERDNKDFDEIILSGYSIKKTENNNLFKETIFFDEKLCSLCSNVFYENLSFSKEVMDVLNKEREHLKISEYTGVYLRGTDYVKLKPKGENVQPSITEVFQKMREIKKINEDMKFFLVTEDYIIYKKMEKEFGKDIKLVSYDTFIKNYKGENFLSQSNLLKSDRKMRGIEYLVKIILLSECQCLISSITMGSISAYALNNNKYLYEYIFDLGKYK